jgi:hypothetical protein
MRRLPSWRIPRGGDKQGTDMVNYEDLPWKFFSLGTKPQLRVGTIARNSFMPEYRLRVNLPSISLPYQKQVKS